MNTTKSALVFFLIFQLLQAGYLSAQTASSSTSDDQTDIAVTVYDANLGLVKDTREINTYKGVNELKFMDVAERINSTTVHIKSLTDPEGLTVLEQNYEYDLLNPQKLMEKYVGKEVHFVEIDEKTQEEKLTKAILLSTNEGNIFQVHGKIMFEVPGRIVLPKIPENLIAKPTLVWLLRADKSGSQKVEASYLTDGINWKADYIAILNQKDTAIDLSGWVTVDNRTGATYNNASLKLVAGDVQRVTPEVRRFLKRQVAGVRGAEAPQFEEEAFFEYHLYTLDRKTTIKDKQTKQINLLKASNIPVKKTFIVRGQQNYYFSRLTNSHKKIGVFLQFKNAKKHHLGMPLPKGIVRVYKKDTEGSLQFIGENRIEHTPKDEKIKIKVGDAFDIVTERKQTEYKKIGDRVNEVAFEITIRNHKDEAVKVNVIEPVSGDWEILNSSHKYEKTSAHEIRFTVIVPEDGNVQVTYNVRVSY